jgi:hypothetical protein
VRSRRIPVASKPTHRKVRDVWGTRPPTKMVTVGVYNNGNMSNWTNVLSSWGYSFGSSAWLGYQASTNSSGTIGGPTASLGPGLSGSYTWGACGGPEAQ